MPTKLPKAPPGRLIGYARVSTVVAGSQFWLACCTRSAQAKPWSWSGLIASPAQSAISLRSSSNSKPLARISAACTTRSTPPPQGMFSLQVLGAVAHLERR
jgi:hypothetical protein